MTEEEAKTKWCPFARVLDWASESPSIDIPAQMMFAAANRYLAPNNDMPRCIGSACMAFRWLPDVTAVLSGNTVIVDPDDADLLEGCWWDGRYAKSDLGRLHRLIAIRVFGAATADDFVDHIDGDRCNNRRGNLRIVTKAQNAANSASRGGVSEYRGVSPARNERWQAQISSKGIRKHLGTFDTEEEAAAAYDAAARELHGEYARPNLTERAHVGRQGFCGLAGKP